MAITKCKECGAEVSTKAKECPKCGAPSKRKTSVFTWVVVVILSFWIIGIFTNGPSTGTSTSSTVKIEPTPKEAAINNTKLDFSWYKAGFGNVMEANFTVQNNSKYQIKDITIECIHSAKSGTVIDTNKQTIYDVVKANTKKTFTRINMGFIHSQASSSSCHITDLVVG